MKTIGVTPTGGVIVEMTDDEHKALLRLQKACQGLGRESTTFSMRFSGLDTDMAETLGAIRLFAETKFQVNDLRSMVDRLYELLEGRAHAEG